MFPELLNEYGCETTVLRGQIKEFTNEEETKSDTRDAIENITKMSRMNHEIGIIVGPHSNHIIVVDETGQILTDEDIVAILCRYYLKYRTETRISVPVTSSMTLERMIRADGGTVERTGMTLRAPEGVGDIFLDGPGRHPWLELRYDPMVVFLRLLEFLTMENAALHDVTQTLPRGNILHTSIYCTADEKAAVMRALSEDAAQKNVEVIDGIRINEQHAWVLVLPDASHPLVHLYGEGDTAEARDAIIGEYSSKIKKFLNSM